jgi:thiamine pyrophosphate-dependent acetolactate synthase large subunit-like protein
MSTSPPDGLLRAAGKQPSRSGAHGIADALSRLEVPVVFGLPGTHNLPIWRALADSVVKVVGVRHEQTAAYAADGYARSSGRLGVALTTTGPGAANAIAATGEAWASATPLLVISTDISTRLRTPGAYRGALHESSDQASMFAAVTKRTIQAQPGADLEQLTLQAAELATTAPSGPVYLGIPVDLLGPVEDHRTDGFDDYARLPEDDGAASPRNDGHHGDDGVSAAQLDGSLRAAAELLRGARRPLLWAGGGAIRSGAAATVQAIATTLKAPVLESYAARGILPVGHPCRVCAVAHAPEIGALWDQSDVVLAIGAGFDGMITQNWAMAQPPKLVAINVDPEDAVKNYSADIVLAGDARALGAALAIELTSARPEPAALWCDLDVINASVKRSLTEAEPEAALFLETMRTGLPEDTVVFADMCIPGYWLAAFHPVPAPRKLAYPVGWGTLGFGFPASIGAAMTQSAPVVCVCGDGGFMFACGELAVLAQEAAPLTVVIFDDGGYGMLRFDQEVAGKEPEGVDLTNPDFVALAKAFGLEAEAVTGVGAELGAALARHTSNGAPSVIVVDAALTPPPSTSPRWYRHHANALSQANDDD